MVIDQPWNDGTAVQIDAARVRPRETADLLAGAGGNDPVSLYSNCLGDCEPVVDRDDFTVQQDQIGRGRLRAQYQSCGKCKR